MILHYFLAQTGLSSSKSRVLCWLVPIYSSRDRRVMNIHNLSQNSELAGFFMPVKLSDLALQTRTAKLSGEDQHHRFLALYLLCMLLADWRYSCVIQCGLTFWVLTVNPWILSRQHLLFNKNSRAKFGTVRMLNISSQNEENKFMEKCWETVVCLVPEKVVR